MGRGPFLVEVAWRVVCQFLREWQEEPYRWEREVCVQTEIVKRIETVLRALGCDTLRANYKNAISGFEGKQVWSRVTCEPTLPYTWTDEKDYQCRPDIVIWDWINDPDAPPDLYGGVFPILWCCEIKYSTFDCSLDVEKLRSLVRRGAIKYGCWIRMRLERASEGDGIQWKRDEEESRVWIGDVRLPALPEDAKEKREPLETAA